MRQSNLFLGITILVAASILFIYGIAALSPVKIARKDAGDAGASVTPLQRPTTSFGNPTRGPKDAKVAVFFFGDYLCQPCAELGSSIEQLLIDFPDDVRLIWKDMPNVQRHGEATNAAVAARCADAQGGFWQYHDLLMANQTSISLNNYAPFAAQLGLELESFQSCIDGKLTQPLVQRDFDEGQRLRIESTPTLFIGDRRVEGAISYEQLRGFVESALSEVERVAPQEKPTE